ncbi:MAG: hypothetical protein AAFV49_15755 [Pseudomonadota bacterium]
MLEIVGVVVLASVWMIAIARLLRRREWSPLRPAVMAIVCAACLASIAEDASVFLAGGDMPNTIYLAGWNLAMALFDLALVVAMRRRITVEPELVAASR